MSRKASRPLRRICVRLFDDDVAFLESTSTGDFGFNENLRTIVSKYVNACRDMARRRIDATPMSTGDPALDTVIDAIRSEM